MPRIHKVIGSIPVLPKTKKKCGILGIASIKSAFTRLASIAREKVHDATEKNEFVSLMVPPKETSTLIERAGAVCL